MHIAIFHIYKVQTGKLLFVILVFSTETKTLVDSI